MQKRSGLADPPIGVRRRADPDGTAERNPDLHPQKRTQKRALTDAPEGASSGRIAPSAKKPQAIYLRFRSGAKENRTPDLLHAMEALYQLSYSPETSGNAIGGTGLQHPPRTVTA